MDMTDGSVVDQRPSGFAGFHATQAEVLTMRVTGRPRGDGDLIDVITYSDGEFTLRFAPAKPGGGVPTIVKVLGPPGRVAQEVLAGLAGGVTPRGEASVEASQRVR